MGNALKPVSNTLPAALEADAQAASRHDFRRSPPDAVSPMLSRELTRGALLRAVR